MIHDAKKELLIISLTVSFAVIIGILMLHYSGMLSAIMVTLLIPLMTLSYLHPRWGLLAFLTYLHFNGTINYAVAGIFKANNAAIVYTNDYPLFQVAKDALYLSALLAILVAGKPLRQLVFQFKPLIIALSIFFGTCLLIFFAVNLPLQLADPASKALLVGSIGLKIWLGYIPLILCAYYFLDRPRDLLILNRWLVSLILICCSLCLLQYLLLVNGICPGNNSLPDPASTKASLQAQCLVGGSLLYNAEKGLTRLPGTFASPWHWGWFLIASSFIAYGASVSEPCRRWQGISWLAMASIIVATLISGQRTALLLVPSIFLILLLLTRKRKRWLLLKLAVLTAATYLLVRKLPIFGEQLENFAYRWHYSPPQKFIATQFHWLLQDRLEWLGQGLGTATNAARQFGSIQLIETFSVKLLYELGILGFLAFLGAVTCLTVLTFRAYRSLKTPSLRRLGLCLWLFILLISYNPYFYPLAIDPVAVYYWFFAGILLKLPELEAQIDSESPQERTSSSRQMREDVTICKFLDNNG
jgi:hypothetical protein